MTTVVYIIHITVCLALIIIVLLQAGKGADMGAAFGGASRTVFGPRGAAGPMAKITVGAAVLFMLTCLYLTWSAKSREGEGGIEFPTPTAPAPTSQPGAPGVPKGAALPTVPGGKPGGVKPATRPASPLPAIPTAPPPGTPNAPKPPPH